MQLSFIRNKILKIKNSDIYGAYLLTDGLPNIIPEENNNTNSFDIFDTLLARRVDNIFDVVEKEFPYPNFKSIREKYFGTIEQIYLQMEKEIEPSICKSLMDFEIQKEIENTYLIIPNYNKVKDGDILVSDMYYTEPILRKILESAGFKKEVTIYVTPNGKASGTIWSIILKNHSIGYHFGDNPHSDIKTAKSYGINTYLSTLHSFTKIENLLKGLQYSKLSFLLREFRHRNPYPYNSIEFKLYNDQAVYNIPMLISVSIIINNYMSAENRTTLLCQTRDGCFLEHIFSTLYPKYICKRLESSRHMNKNANAEYKEYLKSMYDHSTCMLFDLDGSMKSGRELYKEIFGIYPRVYLVQYYTENAPIYDGLSFSFIDKYTILNTFNVDTVGSLIDYKNGEFIRKTPNYSIYYANIFKQTVLSFCDFIKPHISSIPTDTNLIYYIENSYKNVCSHLEKNMED